MTPFEKLIKANDDYHEAVEEIFRDEDIDPDVGKSTTVKAKFGALINSVFNAMQSANNFIMPCYEEEE